MKLKIIDLAYHRNGVAGAPFHVVLFNDAGAERSRKVAIVFEQQFHCAVLDVGKLAKGDVAFRSNSWRGDHFEPSLRSGIADWEAAAEARQATTSAVLCERTKP